MKLFRLSIALLLLALPAIASATATPVQLLADGRLELRTWVEPQGELVTGGQVDLYLEIATDRWFSGGTRVGLFDVENAVVMRRVKMAHNSTRRVKGETWSVQLWQFTLYPQQAGTFEVPSIPVDVSVNIGPMESAEGRLMSPPLSFEVSAPDGMEHLDNWIAVPELDAEQTFNRPAEQLLEVGDALVRTIKVSAPRTASMLLPRFDLVQIPGSEGYQGQPKLADKVDRGDFHSSRTDSFTYVISEPGPVELPPITLHWWNTDKQRLETLVIPGQTFKVNGWAWRYWLTTYGPRAAVVLVSLLVLALVGRFIRQRLPRVARRPGRRASLARFMRASAQGHDLAATDQLYLKATQQHSAQLRSLDGDPAWQRQLDDWLAPQFSRQQTAPAGALSLWRALGARLGLHKRAGRGKVWPRPALSLSINHEQDR